MSKLPEKRRQSNVRHVTDGMVKQGFVTWSADEARTVLEMTSYERQDRHLKEAGIQHIEVLAEHMRMDLWTPYSKIDFARMPDGKMILVNGHHSLSAQIQTGRLIPWVVVIHDCADEEEVAKLYHRFDSNIRIRTEEQMRKASPSADDFNVGKLFETAVMRAVPLIAANLDPAKSARNVLIERIYDLKLELALEFKEPLQKLEWCLENAPKDVKRRILRQGSTAVALVTLKHRPEKAEEFWRKIGDNDKLPRLDPCSTFLTTLARTPTAGSAWASASLAASAWNVYMRGERPAYFKIGEPRPIKLIGTPFEKGR